MCINGVPVRAVVKHASIAFPPFFSASVPACTASTFPVPATKPFPSLNANGLGRRCESYRESDSNLWRSRWNHVLEESETALGGRKALIPHRHNKPTNATKFNRIMAELRAPSDFSKGNQDTKRCCLVL